MTVLFCIIVLDQLDVTCLARTTKCLNLFVTVTFWMLCLVWQWKIEFREG